jgi:hypothetical protein
VIINSLEKFVQLDDYLQFGITANAERIEQILESPDMNSDDDAPIKHMDGHLRFTFD